MRRLLERTGTAEQQCKAFDGLARRGEDKIEWTKQDLRDDVEAKLATGLMSMR